MAKAETRWQGVVAVVTTYGGRLSLGQTMGPGLAPRTTRIDLVGLTWTSWRIENWMPARAPGEGEPGWQRNPLTVPRVVQEEEGRGN